MDGGWMVKKVLLTSPLLGHAGHMTPPLDAGVEQEKPSVGWRATVHHETQIPHRSLIVPPHPHPADQNSLPALLGNVFICSEESHLWFLLRPPRGLSGPAEAQVRAEPGPAEVQSADSRTL